MAWDQPHWSGKRQNRPNPRQRLRPNVFAQLARSSATHGSAVVLLFCLLAMACAGYAISAMRIDPDRPPLIKLDDTTERLQEELNRQFPGIEQTFLALVPGPDPSSARQRALSLADMLGKRQDLFRSAFVPGTGEFYKQNQLLFRELDFIRARVDNLLQTEPLYYALASAPDIAGFSALVTEISKAVEQGRSPPGLTEMLMAASTTIETAVNGTPEPLDWAALAGLDGDLMSQRWHVLAIPQPGMERQAAAFAREASGAMADVTWLWPRRALAAGPSTLRDFVAPAGLSVLFTLLLATVLLGSLRQALAIMLAGAVTLSAGAAAAAAMGRVLDGATWSFALAVLAPVFVGGAALCSAYGACRAKGMSNLQCIMMAAQRQGGFVTVSILLFVAMWASWIPRQMPSLSQFAAIALIGCAVAWLAALTFIPAALSVLAGSRPEAPGTDWIEDALGNQASPAARNAADAAAMMVLAAAIFCAVFLPAVRFGERQLPSSPPQQLETLDARGAVHVLAPAQDVDRVVATLSGLTEVGAIRTADQFMPPDPEPKIAELRRLDALPPFAPAFRPPADAAAIGEEFETLERQLAAIASGPAASPALQDAANRLRRVVMLFAVPEPPAPERVAALERALFGGLGDLSVLAGRLARIEAPRMTDLDPRLASRFISPEGLWRIEVMPRSGVGQLSFPAALRRAVPASAGEPIVGLARNEIIHHETLLAFGSALAATAIIVLLALRNVTGWLLCLAPAAAFLTLGAALTVSLGISLNTGMLAGISASLPVLVASAMRLAAQEHGPGPADAGAVMPLRPALFAPLVLAGAVAPLGISSRPAVAELGWLLAMLLLLAAVLAVLFVPAMSRWSGALARRRPARAARR